MAVNVLIRSALRGAPIVLGAVAGTVYARRHFTAAVRWLTGVEPDERGYQADMATKKRTSNELDADKRNAMSDHTFAFPRVRKEPLNDARHVRNAIARFDQVKDVSDAERDEAFRRIKKAAAKFGVDLTEKSWHELGKPSSSSPAKRSAPKKSTSTSASSSAPSKKELYAEAQRRGVEGRSTMTKSELISALGHR
ncbi:DUF6582 domain-containing protein [Actinoplanes sp. NPDC026619]|uniref:DUF6582 domain-containing protein n=1 Tax=Actinoplanes sp. NPDC026619 TaxID=3155798 RepID=UPI0033CAE231